MLYAQKTPPRGSVHCKLDKGEAFDHHYFKHHLPDLLPIPGLIRRPHHHLEQIHKQQKECTKRRNEIQQLFVASGKLSPIKALTFHVDTIFLIRSLNKLFQSRKFHNKAAESAQKHKRALAKDRG